MSSHDVLPVGSTPDELCWRRACLDLMRQHDADMPAGIYETLFSELELRRPWPDPPDDDEPVSLRLAVA